MIKVENVVKVYPTRSGARTVLNDVSFMLNRGEKLGVLGRNGAGKSTLIRLISGAEQPTSGKVSRTMSVSWPLAFGGAFQGALSGLDNVRFISRIYKQDYRKNIDFVAEFTDLGIYLREPVKSYSQGMRARLAFAISMIIEFDCYLIDEVIMVGDQNFNQKCLHELLGKRQDRSMILASHSTELIQQVCNRAILVHNGEAVEYSDVSLAVHDYSNL